MASPISDVGISIARTEILRALDAVRTLEAKLNRQLTDAGNAALEPFFYTAEQVDELRAQHAAEVEALTPKTSEPRAYHWSRGGALSSKPGATAREAFAGEVASDSGSGLPASMFVAVVAGALSDPRFDAERLVTFVKETTPIFADDETSARHRRLTETWLESYVPKGKRNPVAAPAELVHTVTAQEILRAAAIARGEIVPLPSDPLAREIIRAGAKARNEKDPMT
jgi:hypothetical protein